MVSAGRPVRLGTTPVTTEAGELPDAGADTGAVLPTEDGAVAVGANGAGLDGEGGAGFVTSAGSGAETWAPDVGCVPRPGNADGTGAGAAAGTDGDELMDGAGTGAATEASGGPADVGGAEGVAPDVVAGSSLWLGWSAVEATCVDWAELPAAGSSACAAVPRRVSPR